jgi:tetratricopeptide (TPR) repeat protein
MRFNSSQRGSLMMAAAFLAICVVFLQARIDPLRRQPAIEPKGLEKKLNTGLGNTNAALPFEYTLGALSGFRQVIAGLLWVRSDSFFHSGNYDAILPCIRLITWLDPNWLDPYATGAWHLMYNFTDTDQRSDRRYLPAGLSLLKEGIANNPNQYDMYKEMGWNNYDKIKNYPEAAKYYKAGMDNDPKFDITQIEHALAHSLEKSGKVDESIATWEDAVKRHKAILDDPKASQDEKSRNQSGYENSKRNLFITRVRQFHRPKQTQPPIDVQFTAEVVRVRPKVLYISGQWNLVGSKLYDPTDANKPNEFGKGVLVAGPVDGARVDVRLQDQGYKMPESSEFNFDIDPNLTIMQDALSTRGGKMVNPGGLYVWRKDEGGSLPKDQSEQGIYAFSLKKDITNPGVPLDKALTGGAALSPEGQRQLEAIAKEPLAQLRGDSAKIADLTKQGVSVAKQSRYVLGSFGREIDMSKDPKMYGFKKDKYDLILSINPSGTPDFVQDRIGLLGEGWTDKRYLDTTTVPGVRMIRQVITLSKDDLFGKDRKVLFPPVTVKTASN